MKSILVIDTPDNCSECPICASWQDSSFAIREYWCPVSGNKDVDPSNKPDKCPLTPLPTKYDMEDVVFDRDYDGEYEYGYNACINEILWGNE